MRTEETSGKTVEEAISRALSRLGLRRDQVDVDVITEGKSGFFGVGAQDAVVRVSAKENVIPMSAGPREGGAPASAPAGGGRRDRDEGERDAEASEGGEGGEGGEARRRSRRGRRGGRGRGRAGGEGAAETTAPEAGAGAAAPATERAPRPPRGEGRGEGRARDDRGDRGGRGGRGGGGGRSGGRNGVGEARAPRREREEQAPRPRGHSVHPDDEVLIPGTPDELPLRPIADPADDMDLAGSTLRDILTLLGLTETEITAREPDSDGDGVGLIEQVFDIFGANDDTSDELGVLIGRRGETLAALQYVVNTIVARGQQKAPVFGIDIEGYKRRREQMLVDLAREIAQEVRETGDVITLEPMPAYERRIIHLTLREEPGVKTESVGSGDNRQVEVMPAD
ncbi:MAG: hypothetical protein AMXMBFR23_13160 [Chloroflexota bacterium]